MPIPPFDGILNVLPPHLGDPRNPADLSPYGCSVEDLCIQFATSPARKQILLGLLNLRAELFGVGIRGFQWLGGSFLEDIEMQEGRPPNDVDAVTFADEPGSLVDFGEIIAARRDLVFPQSKLSYAADHYLVSLASTPIRIVESTKYWYGLFSHRRDKLWKGMLLVDLRDKANDDAARIALESKP